MGAVVNLRRLGGRAARLPDGTALIDRRTPFGNPFPIRAGRTREQSIALYRVWLGQRLGSSPRYLEPLRGMDLACWCAPEACHGDVILAALAWTRAHGLEETLRRLAA